MKSLVTTLTAAAMSAAIALSASAPIQAQEFRFNYSSGNQVIDRYCSDRRSDRDCRDYRRDRDRWSRNDYNRFYTRHRGGLDSVAAGIFGFTFATILARGLNDANDDRDFRASDRRDADWDDHVAACEDRYRSYDEDTDSFLGYDGQRHACNL